ncbi:MAG: aromatic amino acid lyase, partial [Flavobacteriales bacterium]|nr:aromatic amino acid lyase [Flavobacteriales bacterium]
EDHVSMGAAAAIKTWHVVDDVERILAIELFTAAQAMEFRAPTASSKRLMSLMSAFRERVPFIKEDVVMHDHMEAALDFVRNVPVL